MNNRAEEVEYISSFKQKSLVGVSIIPYHSSNATKTLCKEKITQYYHTIQTSNLSATDTFKSYMSFWWPSLKYLVLLLSFPISIISKITTEIESK